MIDLGPFQFLRSVDFPEADGRDFIDFEDLLGRKGDFCDPNSEIELPGATINRFPNTGTVRRSAPCCTNPAFSCVCDFVQLDISIPLEFWPLACLVGAESGAVMPNSAMPEGCDSGLSENWGKACNGWTVSVSCTTTRIRLFTHYRANCTDPPF